MAQSQLYHIFKTFFGLYTDQQNTFWSRMRIRHRTICWSQDQIPVQPKHQF